MELLRCENLSLGYDGRKIVENLSFFLESGQTLCIFGENGSGKTTLIKGILGIIKTMDGKIFLDESIRKKEIGYLAQHTSIQNEFPAKVKEVVLSGRLNALGKRFFYSKEDRNIALENMKKLNIEDLYEKSYSEISGGQKQRVLLARALCSTKKLLILDEPESSLDPIVTKELYNIVDEVKKEDNISVIIVSHNLNSSINYADKVLHINKENSFFGTKKEYMESSLGQNFMGGDRLA